MTVIDVVASPRATPKAWLVGGVLAVLVPPIVMGLATRSVAFGLGYVPLLLLWAGIPQLGAWLFTLTPLHRHLPRAAQVATVVLAWAVGGAAVGAARPFLTADRLAGVGIGTVVAVVLLSAANLLASAAVGPSSPHRRAGVLVAVAALIVTVALIVVPYQW